MDIISDELKLINGNFGFILEIDQTIIAATDRTASYQIFFAHSKTQLMIGTHAGQLAEAAELNDIDLDGLLSLEMAGYVTGKRSALKNFSALQAGELVVINPSGYERKYYYKFLPTEGGNSDNDVAWLKKLSDITLSIFDNVKNRASGRQIVVPLSAGFDSRLVLSVLKYLNTDNLISFSYGHKNNFEAVTAQRISESLGISWHFVPMSNNSQQNFFKSSIFKEYLDYSHDFTATPFQQDLFPISKLISSGIIDPDAVIINGNTGDFISGGHIPHALCNKQIYGRERLNDLINLFMKKHFSLWENKFTNSNYERIRQILISDLTDEGLLSDNSYEDFSLWERLEFLNRQSKYVISGQRIYDFMNLNWELPLWSDEYLDFWSQVPLRLKSQQKLYRQMLEQNNWGNVWKNIPVNKKSISPQWIIPLRLTSKLFSAPFGKNTWHKIEKRFFNYWMDTVHNYAISPYYSIILKKSLPRNAISLHTEAYVNFLTKMYNAINK